MDARWMVQFMEEGPGPQAAQQKDVEVR